MLFILQRRRGKAKSGAHLESAALGPHAHLLHGSPPILRRVRVWHFGEEDCLAAAVGRRAHVNVKQKSRLLGRNGQVSKHTQYDTSVRDMPAEAKSKQVVFIEPLLVR